jgi:flagellar protein FliL
MAVKGKTDDTGDQAAIPPAPKKSFLKWVVLSVVLLSAIGAGGAFAWFKFMVPQKVEASADSSKATEGKSTDTKPGEKSSDQAGSSAKIGPIYDLDPFIVNLADADPRFLKVTVKVELDGTLAKTEVGERMPQVRDAILILLSSKDSQGLKPTSGKLQLRDEIIQRINSLLTKGQARNAYFTEFVVQ